MRCGGAGRTEIFERPAHLGKKGSMDGTAAIVAEQIVMMFLVMALGFTLYRVGFIDDRGSAQMSDIVLYVANPVLIAQALMRDFDPQILVGALTVAALALATLLISFALGLVVFRAGSAHLEVGRISLSFSNAGFIGIPLALATIGQDGVFYISVANTVQTVFIWTYGVYLISGDRAEIAPNKVLLNPVIIAMAVGLVCFAASWRPPALIMDAMDMLGDLNTGLVMLVLGAYLGQCRLGEIMRDVQVYRVAALRLVVMPLVTLAVLVAVSRLVAIDEAARMTILMYQSMPVLTLASLLAHKYGRDGAFATAVVAVTTLLSLPVLVIMMYLGGALL